MRPAKYNEGDYVYYINDFTKEVYPFHICRAECLTEPVTGETWLYYDAPADTSGSFLYESDILAEDDPHLIEYLEKEHSKNVPSLKVILDIIKVYADLIPTDVPLPFDEEAARYIHARLSGKS